MAKVYVERQEDGWYLAFNDDGPIVRARSQTATASLAKAANRGAQILVGRREKWRRWQSNHRGRGHRAADQ